MERRCGEPTLEVLGNIVCPKGSTLVDANHRIKKAWASFWAKKDLFLNSNAAITKRVHLLWKTVVKTLLWGVETWTSCKAAVNEYTFTVNDMIRRMLHLKFRPDDSTTEWWQRGLRRAKATLERANLPTVAEHVAKLQWRRARATVVPLIDQDTAKPKLVAVVGEWCAIAQLRKHKTSEGAHGPYFYPSRGRKRRWEEKCSPNAFLDAFLLHPLHIPSASLSASLGAVLSTFLSAPIVHP